MKKKQYQVPIDKPCSEDWSQMLPISMFTLVVWLLILSGYKANGQQNKITIRSDIRQNTVLSNNTMNASPSDKCLDQPISYSIEGSICTKNGEGASSFISVFSIKRFAFSKDDGRFTIKNVPEGSYVITIISRGVRAAIVYDTRQPQTLDIVLEDSPPEPDKAILTIFETRPIQCITGNGRSNIFRSIEDVGVTHIYRP